MKEFFLLFFFFFNFFFSYSKVYIWDVIFVLMIHKDMEVLGFKLFNGRALDNEKSGDF